MQQNRNGKTKVLQDINSGNIKRTTNGLSRTQLSNYDSNFNSGSNNNRLNNTIEPAPSSSINRTVVNDNGNSNKEQTSFNSMQRYPDGKRQQQRQHQQGEYEASNGNVEQQYRDQKYSNARKEASLADSRMSAYKHNSIRNIVSRGREGIFFDEGGGNNNDNESNGMESSSRQGRHDYNDRNKNNLNRVSRRHGGQRRRHRQQPMMLANINMAPLSETAQSTHALTTVLPKLAGSVGSGLSMDSQGNKGLIGSSNSNKNRQQYQNQQSQQQNQQLLQQSHMQILPSVRPQSQSLNQQQQAQQQTQQQAQQQTQQQTQQSQPLRDSLAIYHEDHPPNAAVTSIKGLKPGNPAWRNQDNFFVIENHDGQQDMHLYCVLDGHGEHGHHVSRRARDNFPQHIKAASYDVKRAFYNMQADLCSCEYDVRCSGATCVLAILNGKRLSVSNCGDSRAILGRRGANGSISAFPLSSDHKPEQPEERKRILAFGGHVGCRHVLVQGQGRGGPVSMPVGPCRVWYQNRGETLGLAMSRSLGDSIVHRCGVSAEPETLEHTVDSSDEFVIIATDGVWDVLDNNHACQIAYTAMMAAGTTGAGGSNNNWTLEAANNIAAECRRRWQKLSPMIDDITAIVIRLQRNT